MVKLKVKIREDSNKKVQQSSNLKYPDMGRDKFVENLVLSLCSLNILDESSVIIEGTILQHKLKLSKGNSTISSLLMIDLDGFYTCYYNRIVQEGFSDDISFGISCLELYNEIMKKVSWMMDLEFNSLIRSIKLC